MNKKPSTSIQMIADYEGDITNLFKVEVNEEIPILATRNIVLFPGVISPILVGRKVSINLINHLKEAQDTTFAIFCQKDANNDHPQQGDLYGVDNILIKKYNYEEGGHDTDIIALLLTTIESSSNISLYNSEQTVGGILLNKKYYDTSAATSAWKSNEALLGFSKN